MGKANRSGQAAVLTPQQLVQLWEELDQPYRLVTEIAYFTSGRVGEVVRLRAGDVHRDRIIYRGSITKTGKTRQSQILPELRERMKAIALPSSGYIFPGGGKTGHLTPRAVDKHLRRASALIGLEGVALHSFRRSQATHLHLDGVPLRSIQKITGHSTLASLERYLDVATAEAFAGQAAAMDKLFA